MKGMLDEFIIPREGLLQKEINRRRSHVGINERQTISISCLSSSLFYINLKCSKMNIRWPIIIVMMSNNWRSKTSLSFTWLSNVNVSHVGFWSRTFTSCMLCHADNWTTRVALDSMKEGVTAALYSGFCIGTRDDQEYKYWSTHAEKTTIFKMIA